MTKKKKAVEQTTQGHTLGERFLAIFRDENRHFHAIMWFEFTPKHEKHCIHYLHTDEDGRVRSGITIVSDEKHINASPGAVGLTTLADYTQYLTERLRKYGGTDGAYEALGVPIPETKPAPIPKAAKPQTVERPKAAPRALIASLSDTYDEASKVLGISVKDLQAKYGHLGAGLQAMNLRNRMRSKKK